MDKKNQDKMTNVEIEIVRVPLDDDRRVMPEPKFNKMPILYLELMENKSKIKPELVNRPYEPPQSIVEERSVRTITAVEENSFAAASAAADITTEDDEQPPQKQPEKTKQPPTLEEIQANNPNEVIMRKEYTYPKQEEESVSKRRNEVYFQYQVLKRMHPSAPIPEFTMYTDPEMLAQKYEMIAKKLSLDVSVENWKRYMIIFVMALEVVLGKMSFDVEGFAQQQLIQMNTYDSLLVEMAEKSYTPNGKSKWPVEARLMMMLTVNMAMFIICKMIQKRTGTNLLGTINQQLGTNNDNIMRGPPTSETSGGGL